jgi:hypothetical protein
MNGRISLYLKMVFASVGVLFMLGIVVNGVFADPTLPLPRMPICGDQDGSESPLILNCPDFVPSTDVQAYQVPGNGPVELRFDFVFREAVFNNELFLFRVDNTAGEIGELSPGDPGYLEAAFPQATIVFASGSNAFTPDVTLLLSGGDILVFFIIQDDTLANLQANNPSNDLNNLPLAFFSLDDLNPDGIDHFVGFESTLDDFTQFSFEDLTGGGDVDYDDIVYNVYPHLLPISLAPIDIKSGSDPNSVNCNLEEEVVSVTILTTGTFDATTVDHTTVTFEGASETHVDKKSGEPKRHEEDVDEDGDIDLVLHFRVGDTTLTCDSTEGTLTGKTFNATEIVGTDSIRMVDAGGQ